MVVVVKPQGYVFPYLNHYCARAERWDRDSIRKIIRRYDSIVPLVFGKWGHFDKLGVETMAIGRLKLIADNQELFERGTVAFEEHTSPGLKMEQKICWFFYFWGYYPVLRDHTLWHGLLADPKVWKSVWKEDEDIKSLVIKWFKEEQKKLKNKSVFVEKTLSFLDED